MTDLATNVRTSASPPFAYWHEVALVGIWLSLAILATAVEPVFMQPATQIDMAGDLWSKALLALPMMMIIITAGIDLSVGAIVALAAVVLGMALEAGISKTIAIVATLFVGTTAGFMNGWFIARWRLHALIATLAGMAIYRGLALILTKGRTIQVDAAALGLREDSSLLGLPAPMVLFLLMSVLIAIFLHRTAYGRFLYAIGLNPIAARYSGVPTTRIQWGLYTFSGFVASLSAVFMAARYGQVKADFGTGLELEVITAVVLGGVSIFGGRGNVIGVLLGLVIIHLCSKFMSWHFHMSELTSLVIGAILIGSVLVNSLIEQLRGSTR